MELTKSQTDAVESEAALTVVVAGPGSGKTRTLTERIKKLLARGVSAREIVVITFTNAAAREIENRIGQDVAFFYCGTVHGFMLRIVKDYGKLIGFRGKIAMLDENQQERLIKQTMSDARHKGPIKDVKAEIAKGPERFLEKYLPDRRKEDLFLVGAEQVAFEYYQRLLSSGMVDFDSLLKFGRIILERMAAAKIPQAFKFLFWDEFQDSGADDAAIFRLIDVPNKYIVGDADQSIYGFRGGSPSYLLTLAENKDHFRSENSSVIFLRENFRCDSAITDAANRLIKQNANLHCGTTSMQSGGKVWTVRTDGESGEMRELAEDIRSQPNFNECAILVRFNALADLYAKGMESYGIPVAKKEKVAKPSDWQVARSLINLFANPDNDLLAYWWIEQQKDTKFANKIKLESLGAFTTINRHFLKLPDSIPPGDVPAALGRSGISAESIQIVNKALGELPDGATLAELSFTLGDEELHKREVGQGLTVTTMHSAKGREWDSVYLPAFEEGNAPSLSKTATIEEERRLAFVAITRARHRLWISFANMRKPAFGGWKPEKTTPSRFIEEIRRRE